MPIAPGEFADPKIRARWAREKNMVVLNFYHKSAIRDVDLFVPNRSQLPPPMRKPKLPR